MKVDRNKDVNADTTALNSLETLRAGANNTMKLMNQKNSSPLKPTRPNSRVISSLSGRSHAMRRTLSALCLCTLAGFGGSVLTPTTAFAQGSAATSVKSSGALQVREADDGTYIRLRGTGEPTFSVFKLTNPLRLFVDVSGWEPASGDSASAATRNVSNGVISKVALVGVDENARPITRLIIGFDEAAHYDVKADGNDIVVFVDGAKRQQAPRNLAQVQQRTKQLEAERQAALKRAEELSNALGSARSELDSVAHEKDQVKARLAKMAADAQRSAQKVDTQIAKLEAAQNRQRELETQIDKLRASLAQGNESVRSELAEFEKTRDQLNNRLKTQRSELQAARTQADKANQRVAEIQALVNQRESEITRLRAELQQTRARQKEVAKGNESLEAARKKNAQELASLQKLRQQLKGEQQRMAALETKRQAEQTRLAELASERQAAQRQLADTESQLAERRQELEAIRSRENLPAARAVALNAQEANSVRDIRLETVNGRSRIIVELNRASSSFETLPSKDSRAVMILNNVSLPDALERTLSSDAQSGAVRLLSSYTDREGNVRVEAELGGKTSEIIRQDGNQVVWEFAPEMTEELAQNAPQNTVHPGGQARPSTQGTSFTSAPPNYPRTVADPSKVSTVPGMKRKRLTIDLRSADIQNVLRLLAKEGGVNIISGDGVKGSVTMRLRSVPLDQVFLTVLNSQGLGFEVRGNVIRVAPQATLLAEQKARAEARASAQQLEPLEVFLMPVNYAAASEMQPQVQGLLSPRGSVTVDARTNTLIIKDLAANLTPIRALVESLDSQVPQVLIEARIVETNDTFTRQLGIQWGGDFSFSQGNGNPTGLIFPSVLGVAGGATDGETNATGTSSNPNFAVNLPAPAGTGSGGAIGLTMGSVGGAVNLNLRLSAMEASGHAKIVSAPRILTMDNTEATISQGTSIPISVVSAAGVQTVFVDATLELTVTPHVTPDGNVQLKISASKNEPDFQNTGARGDPTIIRKQAETELLIKDGDTTVIGGIYTRNSGSSLSAVPFLHKIPILGALFKSTSTSERRTELLIFITPRIVNRQESLGSNRAGGSVDMD